MDIVQATAFLRKLGIQNWEGRLELLRNIVRKYITHPDYAFQNLSMAAALPATRCQPTPASSVTNCSELLRGMCIDHNYFLSVFLRGIGFETWVVGSTVSLLPMPMNHPLCVVRLEGGLWLVDLGMGSVFHEPVPLHNLPYSFSVGGFTCEYRRIEEGGEDVYQRVHIGGDPMKGKFDVAEEVRYHFTLRPVEYEEFDGAMQTIFTDAEASYFLNNLYVFRYLELTENNFKAVVLMGTTLILFSNTDFTKEVFESYEALSSVFRKYFPNLPFHEYTEATQYFQTSNERKSVQ